MSVVVLALGWVAATIWVWNRVRMLALVSAAVLALAILNVVLTTLASRTRARRERGAATLEFIILIGVLFFPLCGLIAVTNWPARLNAAEAAAYEAARTAVEAEDLSAGAEQGRARALEVIENHGFDPSDVAVSFSAATRRGGELTATVTIALPALTFPGVTSWEAATTSRSNTQRVPDYRGFG